jgi:hypothetical protein
MAGDAEDPGRRAVDLDQDGGASLLLQLLGDHGGGMSTGRRPRRCMRLIAESAGAKTRRTAIAEAPVR